MIKQGRGGTGNRRNLIWSKRTGSRENIVGYCDRPPMKHAKVDMEVKREEAERRVGSTDATVDTVAQREEAERCKGSKEATVHRAVKW